jgi:ribonuclease HII
MDEVGRGALAGPVVLGVALLTVDIGIPPAGIRDSKLLSAGAREALLTPIQEWAIETSVGSAGAAEIDQFGIIPAMGLAGRRALAGLTTVPDAVFLDGNMNYLGEVDATAVFTQVKGDLHCAGIAAASIVAKCFRDQLMRELDISIPGYHFARNKGYSSPTHIQAIAEQGVSQQHRSSWKLPGVPR